MRRVLLFVDLTLDGFMGGPDGEMDWLVPDDEMDKEFTIDLRETADTILTGRVAYESFAAFWPAAASDPASPRTWSTSPPGWSTRRRWCSPPAWTRSR